MREALFQRVDAQPEPFVISHDEGGDASKHHEDRRKRRALVREEQGYTCQEGGDTAESKVSRSQRISGTIAKPS